MNIIATLKRQNWWLNMTLLFFFFAPLSRAYISLYAILFPIFWLVFRPKKNIRQLSIETKKLLFVMFAFVIWQAITLFWTSEANMQLGIKNFLYYTYWLIIPLIVFTVPKEKIKYLVSAFLLGMLLSELIAYGMFFELWKIGNKPPSNPSPFMIHIEYSVFLAMMGFLLLGRIFSTNYQLSEKVFFFIFLLSSTGNLFLTNGRTGQFAFLIGLIFMFVLKFRNNKKYMLVGVGLALVFFFSAFQLSNTFHHRVVQSQNSVKSLIKKGECFTSIGQRACAWVVVGDMVKEAPLLGVGLGDYKQVFRERIFNHYPNMFRGERTILNDSHLHNQYLMVLVQSGVVGLLLMLLLLFYLFILPIKSHKIWVFKQTFIVVYFIACFAEPLWLKQFSMILFTIFVSVFILYNNHHLYDNDETVL